MRSETASDVFDIINEFDMRRGSGHTHAMACSLNGNETVIVSTMQQSDDIMKVCASRGIDARKIKFVSIGNADRLRGCEGPIIIDHFALRKMFGIIRGHVDEVKAEASRCLSERDRHANISHQRQRDIAARDNEIAQLKQGIKIAEDRTKEAEQALKEAEQALKIQNHG